MSAKIGALGCTCRSPYAKRTNNIIRARRTVGALRDGVLRNCWVQLAMRAIGHMMNDCDKYPSHGRSARMCTGRLAAKFVASLRVTAKTCCAAGLPTGETPSRTIN
jgi:hypothetical protein